MDASPIYRKRVRKKRRRRTAHVWKARPPAGASERRLLAAVLGFFGLGAVLALLLLSPGAPGFGTIRADVSRSGGGLSVVNGDDYGWGSVLVRSFPLLGPGLEDTAPSLPSGSGHSIRPTGAEGSFGPSFVVVTCEKPGAGRTGFWLGFAP